MEIDPNRAAGKLKTWQNALCRCIQRHQEATNSEGNDAGSILTFLSSTRCMGQQSSCGCVHSCSSWASYLVVT
eukprot:401301-Pelagomonas_calceolata.AAC.2